ncbi:MAG: gltX [Candidatus Saccharibacteria bacterium]|nr:gltX [Candidatus Saccharibacteria bacterium]
MTTVRTRFAPSPTGYLHVGGIRTALFAFLLARQANGQFVLRLEDTDKKREVAGSDQHLMDSLKALGLQYDEGPDIGGPFAPYRQSERLDHYQGWAKKLIDSGRAYADPYTSAEVEAFREQAKATKKPFLFRNHRPENPPAWDGSQPLRFKSDPKAYDWQDAVMGKLHTGPEVVDDFILVKSDGYPTYNFAHIVDDAEMEISHIIRGQEFLASIPNYLNLYEALELTPPIMATMPHVLGPSGNKKLSKRDGAKDVLDYLREGYLPEALVNFIATLGWNDATEQEIFTIPELIEKFSLEHVGRGGARFDEQRLLWMNGSFIRNLSLDELFERCAQFWPPEAADASDDYKKQVLGLVQERLKYFGELPELSRFFFIDLPINADLISSHKQLKKYEPQQLKLLLEKVANSLESSDFTASDLQERLNVLLEETGEKPAVLFSLVRIATTQAPASPSLAETLSVLGKVVSLRRLQAQLAAL